MKAATLQDLVRGRVDVALYLKETAFRFNHRGQNLYLVLLKLFRDFPMS